MKKTLIAVLILASGLTGVCLAGNNAVGTQPSPPAADKPTPNNADNGGSVNSSADND